MDPKQFFDAAYRAIACTPNLNQDPTARSSVERAAAEIREAEKSVDGSLPAAVSAKVIELIDVVLAEKHVDREEHDDYLRELRGLALEGR